VPNGAASQVHGLGQATPDVATPVVVIYRAWWAEILAGMAFATGALVLYAIIDFAIDGKLDLRHFRRSNGR
jgi:predicted anti-sigma-YlaC factor YlaD